MESVVSYTIQDMIDADKRGLLGLECASAYWGMSTFRWDMPIFLIKSDCEEPIDVPAQISFFFANDICFDNSVKLSDKLSIIDREQTVCDMIRYDRQEFHLYETILSAFEDDEVDIDKLNRLAKKFGIYDRLYKLKELAEEDADEIY